MLSGDGQGSWDSRSTAASVLVEGDQLRMWYSGTPVFGSEWSIGLATASVGLVVEPSPRVAGLMQNRPNPFATATEIRYAIAQRGPVSTSAVSNRAE